MTKAIDGIDGRFLKIEGQIRGIRSMARDGRDCVEIIGQIAAARGALKKVADLMVADHVERWLEELAPDERENGRKNIEELLTVFNQYYR
jgi:DNA-binding FrmR family transcriptional regulator